MIILNVKAQESVTPEQALTLLTQISNLDTTKYTPELKTITGDPEVLQHIEYSLTSNNSKIEVTFTVKNNTLTGFRIYPVQGEPITNKQSTNVIEEAKTTLDKYQAYTKTSYIIPIKELLNTITEFEYITKTSGNIKLEIIDTQDNYPTFQWTNTFNGIDNDYNRLILRFDDKANLVRFSDTWNLYTINYTEAKIQEEEAIELAKDHANNYSYKVGDIKVDDFIIVDNPVKTELNLQPREDNILYPWWSIQLYFDKVYPGQVTGLHVTMWADTGDITDITPITGGGIPDPTPTPSPSPTPEPEFPTTLVLTSVVTIIVGVGILTYFKKRKT